MILVDSRGWLKWFTDGQPADRYEKYLLDPENILMPAVVLYEVYRILKREAGEDKTLLAAGYMKNSNGMPFDETLAVAAADIALQENLAMADAMILAAARANDCEIITSDSDLKNRPNVTYQPKIR